MEDEDGEVVKTYELPSSRPETGRPSLVKKDTWLGMAGGFLGGRKESTTGPERTKSVSAEKSDIPSGADSPKPGPPTNTEPQPASAVRHGLARMGTWGFGGRGTEAEKKPEHDSEDDDRRIRFTIGGAGRRLTKDDFLREIQSLDPKGRAEMVDSSDASPALKAQARKGSGVATGGNTSAASRLLGAAAAAKSKNVPDVEETEEEPDSEDEKMRNKNMKNALQLSRKKDAPVASSSTPPRNDHESDIPETDTERKRREQVLKGVSRDDDDDESEDISPSRGRGRGMIVDSDSEEDDDEEEQYQETAAEKRRREAALGLSGADGEKDSDDDGAPRVPPPAAKPLRGIRFAQSPVRAGKK